MISYKIISQEAYANLQKLSEIFPFEKSLLVQTNNQLIEKLQQMKKKSQNLQLQLQAEHSKNVQLSADIQLYCTKIVQISLQLTSQIQNRKSLSLSKDETSNQLNDCLNDKNSLEVQKTALLIEISEFKETFSNTKQRIFQFQVNQQLLQSRITQLDAIINRLNKQKQELSQNLQQKQTIIQNLNSVLQQKSELIEKIVAEYENCKEEKLACEKEIQIFKESPISKLQEKLQAKETWINELTKTINELRQRCVQLQMDRPHPTISYNLKSNALYSVNPTAPYSTIPHISSLRNNENLGAVEFEKQNILEAVYRTNKLRQQEAERLKYLKICKQLVQQFNAKLSKIQHQKKSMEEKYQSIKLKINEYQYKEFTYKDKIGLYLKKIEKFQKLTQKQQSQMEKLILQFDYELNNVIRMKEEEVKLKFEEQIEKYQQQLQKLKEQEYIAKKPQANESMVIYSSFYKDQFEYKILKIQLEQAQKQGIQKSKQLEKAKKDLTKLRKQLEKYKQSKQSYKQKAIDLEELCYENSNEIRRYKSYVQQLQQQLEIKTNENMILKSNFVQNCNVSHRSDGTSKLENGEEFYQSLSAKVSSKNNVSAGKRSVSDHYEYQVSEIDTELQKRNQLIIKQILIGKRVPVKMMYNQQELNTPAYPSRISQITDPAVRAKDFTKGADFAVNQSISSMSKSQISSLQQSESSNSMNSSTSNQNKSFSSKNSYQSYGIKYLYTDRTLGSGNKSLLHKNSLQ